MTIYNIGSINIDRVYRVPRLPSPGETVLAAEHASGLGGKGANQSVAIARAGGHVVHIGAVGPEGGWVIDALAAASVDVGHLATLATPTGHAIITVNADGENMIVVWPGANRCLTDAMAEGALAGAVPGDWLLFQNETNLPPAALPAARAGRLKVCYSAAPFSAAATAAILPQVDLVAMNRGEAHQLAEHLGTTVDRLPVPAVLVTDGARGARYWSQEASTDVSAHRVTPVDTTGAGDCFLGTFLAARDGGASVTESLRRAAATAALQVQRPGAAGAMPMRQDVDAFLGAEAAS